MHSFPLFGFEPHGYLELWRVFALQEGFRKLVLVTIERLDEVRTKVPLNELEEAVKHALSHENNTVLLLIKLLLLYCLRRHHMLYVLLLVNLKPFVSQSTYNSILRQPLSDRVQTPCRSLGSPYVDLLIY